MADSIQVYDLHPTRERPSPDAKRKFSHISGLVKRKFESIKTLKFDKPTQKLKLVKTKPKLMSRASETYQFQAKTSISQKSIDVPALKIPPPKRGLSAKMRPVSAAKTCGQSEDRYALSNKSCTAERLSTFYERAQMKTHQES